MSDELLAQLIKMVASSSAKLDALADDVKSIKDTLHTFRSETDVHFRKLDRRVKLIESDLDETMVNLAEITNANQ